MGLDTLGEGVEGGGSCMDIWDNDGKEHLQFIYFILQTNTGYYPKFECKVNHALGT